jgi:hypothetical protein
MHLLRIFGFITALTISAQAQTLVPASTSPDHKFALYYEHPASALMNERYTFYFRNTRSLSVLSSQLAPPIRTDLTTDSAMDDEDSDILFDGIGSHFEAQHARIVWDTGFEYFVAWSPDSQWVSLEGGAHKFWRVMIYRQIAGRFQRVMLSDLQLGDYFKSHKDDLSIQDLGVAVTLHKISPHDQQNVCWLSNGTLAINAYPYLLRDSAYQKLETHDFFFVADAHTNPATITGFCR